MVHNVVKDPVKAQQVYFVFTRNVIFGNNNTVCNITKLVHYYSITGPELLMALYNNASPFGMGVVEFLHHDKSKLTLEEANKILSEDQYIDYLNGVPIKQNFNMTEDIVLNIKSYDDRHFNGALYQRFFKLLLAKMENTFQ